MSSRDDHYELGFSDAAHGNPRYVFQDPVLQERYDRGYKAALHGTEIKKCRGCGKKIISTFSYCHGCLG